MEPEVASGTTAEDAMTIDVEHQPIGQETGSDSFYPPDLLPLLQSLLADVADIDCAYETSLESIRRSPGDHSLKHAMIDRLRQQHEKRRAPVAHVLMALQQRIEAVFS
jgi:hypothetical protein